MHIFPEPVGFIYIKLSCLLCKITIKEVEQLFSVLCVVILVYVNGYGNMKLKFIIILISTYVILLPRRICRGDPKVIIAEF